MVDTNKALVLAASYSHNGADDGEIKGIGESWDLELVNPVLVLGNNKGVPMLGWRPISYDLPLIDPFAHNYGSCVDCPMEALEVGDAFWSERAEMYGIGMGMSNKVQLVIGLIAGTPTVFFDDAMAMYLCFVVCSVLLWLKSKRHFLRTVHASGLPSAVNTPVSSPVPSPMSSPMSSPMLSPMLSPMPPPTQSPTPSPAPKPRTPVVLSIVKSSPAPPSPTATSSSPQPQVTSPAAWLSPVHSPAMVAGVDSVRSNMTRSSPCLYSPSIASSSEPASPEFSPGGDTLSAYKRKLQGMVGVMVNNTLKSQEQESAIDFDDMEAMLLGEGTSSSMGSNSLVPSPSREDGSDGRVYNTLGNGAFSDGRFDDALQYYEMARAMYGSGEEDEKFLACISSNIDVTVKRILKNAVESPGLHQKQIVSDDEDDLLMLEYPSPVSSRMEESRTSFSPVVSPRHSILNRVVPLVAQPSPKRITPDSIADFILEEEFQLSQMTQNGSFEKNY